LFASTASRRAHKGSGRHDKRGRIREGSTMSATSEQLRPVATSVATSPAGRPLRLHHHAFVTRDQEANRQLLEDVLGIPLAATWCEETFNPRMNREVQFCHTFYEMADGGALAFFQFADPELYELAKYQAPEVDNFDHCGFLVEKADFERMAASLKASGLPYRERNHGYCRSLYCKTPDGLNLEFVYDAPNAEELGAIRRADAHSELKRWLAGDHRSNNDWRDQKF